MSRMTLPLFPLHTVLFPGGLLPLRIFEPRYLDMISACLKQGGGFGICLIREGKEVGEAARTYDIGTLVRIDYFEKRNDGLLGITVQGERRFRVLASTVTPHQLLTAEVELLAPEQPCAVPAECAPLAEMLRQVLAQLDYPYAKLAPHYDDATWLGARLIELMPFKLEVKQYLLQMDDPLARLERLGALLEDGIYS